MSAEDVINQPARAQFEVFLDEHRSELNRCLDGLTEEQARQSLVPSRTTLLGMVKHATFVEKVWFDEAVTCRSRAEIGPPRNPVIAWDIPKKPEPLPKFLDDPDAARLMAAARASTDPRDRLVVELLARTGKRAGELADLDADAVVRIGAGHWLRIPRRERALPQAPYPKPPAGRTAEPIPVTNQPACGGASAWRMESIGQEMGVPPVTGFPAVGG